jgi:hypothetical protein
MKEQAHRIRGTLYLATYEHKHGIDYSIHATHEGAKTWANSVAEDWRDDYVDSGTPEEAMSSSELADNWGDLTGGTEWLNIIELELQK